MSDMTRKPPSSHRAKKSETLEVRLPHDTKQEFLTACRDDGTTASEVVRGSIQDYLETRLRPEPQTQTAKILTMIPQPIRKKRYLAAGVGALGLAAMIALPSAADPDFMSVFKKLDKNGDGVLTSEEFGGPATWTEGKDVRIERKIVKTADGTTTETETVLPAGASTSTVTLSPSDGDGERREIRIERIMKDVDLQAAGGKAPVTGEEAVAYWIPGEAGKDEHQVMIAEHKVVKVVEKDGDAPLTVDLQPNPFSAFDTDGDGKISFDEFKARNTALLTNGFNKLDANGDRLLSSTEYAGIANPVVVSLGKDDEAPNAIKIEDMPKTSPETVTAAFKSLDKNKDGKLSLQEYLPPS